MEIQGENLKYHTGWRDFAIVCTDTRDKFRSDILARYKLFRGICWWKLSLDIVYICIINCVFSINALEVWANSGKKIAGPSDWQVRNENIVTRRY